MKKNQTDSTLRNVQATNKRIEKLEADMKALKSRVSKLEREARSTPIELARF